MGIDLGDPDTPVPAGRNAPKKKTTKGKDKVVGESSQPDVHVTPFRRKWAEDEYAGVAKAWLTVCDDPLVANNQRVVNMWAKIRAAYRKYCPHGKDYSGEECRKGWEHIRAAVRHFSALYANALRQLTSGQNEEDARRIAESQFPLATSLFHKLSDFSDLNSATITLVLGHHNPIPSTILRNLLPDLLNSRRHNPPAALNQPLNTPPADRIIQNHRNFKSEKTLIKFGNFSHTSRHGHYAPVVLLRQPPPQPGQNLGIPHVV